MIISFVEADFFLNFKLFRLLQCFSLSQLYRTPEVALNIWI